MKTMFRSSARRVFDVALLNILVGCLTVATGQDFSEAARASDFKTFVQDFANNYVYLDQPDKPWLTWELRYNAAARRADSKDKFNSVLAAALSELHDFHAEVRSPVSNRWLPVPTFADIWSEFQGNEAVVVAVRRGSDAERAGVNAGDRVLKVGSAPLEQALRERLTPAVNQASAKAQSWALLSVLTGRADQGRTFTLKAKNTAPRTVTLPVKRQFDRGPGELSVATLQGGIGLIRLNNSLGKQETVAAFDQALNQVRSTKGLVLDLRDVPSGGDSSVALGIMGRFVRATLPYQRHRIPHYGQPDVERNWTEFVAPRGSFTYTAPLVVLVDHWTGSMGEGMAIGFDAMQRARVIGTAMAHLGGAVTDFRLPKTGSSIAYATEQLFHVNGTPRQDWLPSILVSTPVTKDNDAILSRALQDISMAGK